jgi:hypothetical protein
LDLDLVRESGVENRAGVRMSFAAADVGVFQEFGLAHEVGFGAVGEGHLVVEDGGVGAAPGVGVIQSRPTLSRAVRTLRRTLEGQR